MTERGRVGLTRKSVKRTVVNPTVEASAMAGKSPCHRKGQRLNRWSEEHMKEAIIEFKAGGKGLREISRAWGVPKATLARRVKGGGIKAGWKHASGKQPILPGEAESELAQLIMMLSNRGFPLKRKDVQRLAFEYATEHHLKGFSATKGTAGYYWFRVQGLSGHTWHHIRS